MSDFGEYKYVKTRKEHWCIYCGRKIPVGLTARQYKGMFEGDWQNWYACGFCEEIVEPDYASPGEYITGDEFNRWLRDQKWFETCPNYHETVWPKHNSWDWCDNDTAVEIECHECGVIWKAYIPFEIIKSPLPTIAKQEKENDHE